MSLIPGHVIGVREKILGICGSVYGGISAQIGLVVKIRAGM